MKLVSMILALMFVTSSTLAQMQRPPSEQVTEISGNSLVEKKVQWLWKSVLPSVVKACRALPSCQMSAAENKILDQIIANLSIYTSASLRFENENQNSGRFTSDLNETHRIAVTGSVPQSTIFLNLDRIGTLSLGHLVAMLGHEVVHHTGVADDARRIPDQIGAKLGRYFELNSLTSSLEEYGHPEIQSVYFGVSLPETDEYFKIFPAPTVSAHAKSIVMDSENLYDIDSFEPYSPFHCYTVPGSALVNEQVSDPKIHVNRWFQGDSEISVSMNILIRSVCIIVSHAPAIDLTGSRAIGQTTLQLVLKDPSVQNWQQSQLKIRANFIRANFRPSANLENPEITNFAKVEKIVSAPATVAAGENYRLQLLVSLQDKSATLPCDSYFDNNSWHSLDMTSLIPFRNFDECEATRQSPDLYLVTLTVKVPVNAAPGYYGVETVDLMKSNPQQMVSASFPSRIVFQVLNPRTRPLPRILSFEFIGLGTGKLVPDKTYDFEVRIADADNIHSSFISGRFNEQSGHHLDFAEEVAHSQKSMFRLVGYRYEGSVLIAGYKALIPGPSQNAAVSSIELYTFNYHTNNWAEAYLDLRQRPAVFEVSK